MYQTFIREIKIKRSFIIIFCLIIIALVVLYTVIYPSIQSHASQLIKSLGNIYKDVGIQGIPSFATLESYMSLETFGFTWPIMASIFAIGLAGSSLAGEIERRTLGMLLAMPITRSSIYLAKLLAGLLSGLIFVILSVFTILPLAAALKIHFVAAGFTSVALLCFLFFAAIYSLALMVSSLASDKSKVYIAMGGVVVAMYVANTVSGLKNSLSGLKYISFFHYLDSQTALVSHHISLISIFIFIAVFISCSIIGSIVFIKRDVSI